MSLRDDLENGIAHVGFHCRPCSRRQKGMGELPPPEWREADLPSGKVLVLFCSGCGQADFWITMEPVVAAGGPS
jgi:hypothetical protein